MAIWRVMGISAADERSQVVFVRTNLKERAVELAAEHGVVDGVAQPSKSGEALGQKIIPDPDASARVTLGRAPGRTKRLAESALIRRPIETIATGVFLGMLMYAVVSFVVTGLLNR